MTSGPSHLLYLIYSHGSPIPTSPPIPARPPHPPIPAPPPSPVPPWMRRALASTAPSRPAARIRRTPTAPSRPAPRIRRLLLRTAPAPRPPPPPTRPSRRRLVLPDLGLGLAHGIASPPPLETSMPVPVWMAPVRRAPVRRAPSRVAALGGWRRRRRHIE